ncbi:hypothetical protein EW146_g1314 [Bondarzewia mesenterica]|uniref:Uncharacterized protein n=1 Tax=Bondarzewia mesenterica TaxID=1095465 RepID=A0A4S4M494_9AGAM|nr:hypothetical protein EW146_g1314 [Bondarzewia mesenterica]
MSTDTEARSRALREELAQARSQLTAERNQRALEEAAAREQSSQDALSRHQRLMDQLNDLKTLLSGQYDEQVRHRERAERDMAEENRRRSEKEARAAELGNMGSRIEQDRETERARLEEERAAAATKPSTFFLCAVVTVDNREKWWTTSRRNTFAGNPTE